MAGFYMGHLVNDNGYDMGGKFRGKPYQPSPEDDHMYQMYCPRCEHKHFVTPIYYNLIGKSLGGLQCKKCGTKLIISRHISYEEWRNFYVKK